MATLLMRDAEVLLCMDDAQREIPGGGIFVRDGVIEAVGARSELPDTADRVIDLRGHVLMPGMVNTHHHLYQNLTRLMPEAQNAPLFGWLQALYPVWERLTPEAFRVSAILGLGELLLSGCTTSSDHQYIFPHGSRLDDSIAAARETGIRFHALRGSMSVGQSAGGLPPDSLVESEDSILADSERLIAAHHDPSPASRVQVALAPCSPFSVSPELMRDSADLARKHGVRLHTHLAENVEDVAYSRERFNMTPGEYAEDLGWLGDDVWHAHCVQLDAHDIKRFASTGTSVAHCPCSNMRLASGIAPVMPMLHAGVNVGLGVDGSSSNDSGHILSEARQALLLQRLREGADACGVRDMLKVATRGGARALGREAEIGQLSPGYQADCAAFAVNDLWHAGASHDPVASILLCYSGIAAYTVVGGDVVVDQGTLRGLDLPPLLAAHRQMAERLANGERAS
ncbi:8-oxoguanine deaminase [Congregibacter litoralis]|uniref:Cytosine deaminase n=1 Tax=Congregibacter litoralis KT71 TaxID=314285 RepID=A4A384_9GAMM|nr:8-oxoguanine deaminase [Congregibacter litoralis]EAQ99157.2 Cytosine deaminase [Congregibacter litoralis KT71]